MHTQLQQHSNEIASAVAAALPDLPPRYPYYTVAQFCKRNRVFTEPAVRNLIFKADARESTRGTIPGNGLLEAGAIVRLGKKVLLHEERFFAWLERQGTAGSREAPAVDSAPGPILPAAGKATQKRSAQKRTLPSSTAPPGCGDAGIRGGS